MKIRNLYITFLGLLISNISFAGKFGGSGESAIVIVLENILSLATGSIMRAVFMLFIVGCLYLAFINRLDWGYAVKGCAAAGGISAAGEIGRFLLNGVF
tara:strand:- start:550 stop:846 length:297 start_codon:yes stop_codon:yes gene_type:complete